MRYWLVVLGKFCCGALIVFGAVHVLISVGERDKFSQTSHGAAVGFTHAGAECDNGDRYSYFFSIDNGELLECTWGSPGHLSDSVSPLPGFPLAQGKEVVTLAARLGVDGLSAADQRQIQNRVDEIAATVPPANITVQVHAPGGLWGPRRMALGAGMIGGGILGYVALRRLQRRPMWRR